MDMIAVAAMPSLSGEWMAGRNNRDGVWIPLRGTTPIEFDLVVPD